MITKSSKGFTYQLPQHYRIVVSGADKTVVAVKVLHSIHVGVTLWVPGTGRYQGLGVGFTYSSHLPVDKSVHTVKKKMWALGNALSKNYFKDFFSKWVELGSKSTHFENKI